MKSLKANSTFNIKESSSKLEELTDKEAEKKLKKVRGKLSDLQEKLYAHGKYSVLICLQGMDTSGKDSLIREVFKKFNTSGIEVHSFKVPTELELKHDFLWRHYIKLPPRGKFGIFNRTHYENVLVTKVHPEYILGENIPGVENIEDIDDDFWSARYEQIRNFEKHLTDNGTIVFKFFLNLSKNEQKRRLIRRIEKEEKNWKFSPSDLKERKLWDKYQECYEKAIQETSTENAPWYVIPADSKPMARYLVAKTIFDQLETFKDIAEPELDEATKNNLLDYLKQLNEE